MESIKLRRKQPMQREVLIIMVLVGEEREREAVTEAE